MKFVRNLDNKQNIVIYNHAIKITKYNQNDFKLVNNLNEKERLNIKKKKIIV